MQAVAEPLFNPCPNRRRRTKLTEDQVRLIRKLVNSGHTLESVAAIFNISAAGVRAIVVGKIWKHLV
jgi:hypothetical protein